MQRRCNGVVDRLLGDHARITAIIRRLEPFLAREKAPVEREFAQLRWSLLRELTQHQALESTVMHRTARASSSADHGSLSFALKDHMTQWNCAAVHAHWPRYTCAARALLSRLQRQMHHEEQSLFPHL